MPKTKKCGCGEPGEHQGIVYVLGKGKKFNPNAKNMGLKKKVEAMCPTHFLENTFGLWPFVCVRKACRKSRQQATGIKLDEGDMIVWIRLEVTLAGTLGRGENLFPLCPWCSKSMKAADRALVSTAYASSP